MEIRRVEVVGPKVGKDLKTKAMWEGANLVVDRDWGSGVNLDETYFRAPETPQLYVIISFKTPRISQPMEFRRVYDRVAGPK